MKRLCFLAVLLTLSSSAHAGRSFSFNLGKHRVHVESARHCHSLKCAAVSISKRLHWRQRRDRYEDERDATMPARPVPAVPQTVSPPAPPPSAPPKAIVDATPAPVYTAAASRTYPADPPPLAPQVQDVSVGQFERCRAGGLDKSLDAGRERVIADVMPRVVDVLIHRLLRFIR